MSEAKPLADRHGIWAALGQHTAAHDRAPEAVGGDAYDVLVVGAGITGLTSAVLLAESGLRVGVLEAHDLRASATVNSTGKLSLLHGQTLSSLRSKRGDEVAAAYVQGNLAAIDWARAFCAARQVPLQERTSILFSRTEQGVKQVAQQREAAEALRLPVGTEVAAELPFEILDAVTLDGGLQLNPYELILALVERATELGVHLSLNTRVTRVDHHRTHVDVHASRAGRDLSVRGGHVIIGTGFPIVDRSAEFTTLTAYRSYALGFETGMPLLTGMYLGLDRETISLREYTTAGRHHLVVGGAGHKVGASVSSRERVDALSQWGQETFGLVAPEKYRWSAQDYEEPDAAPSSGVANPVHPRILYATGYNKWGLSNGIAAAHDLRGRILDERAEWMHTLYDRRVTTSKLGGLVARGAEVGVTAVGDWARAELSTPEAHPAEGEGSVGRSGGVPVAVSTVDGVTRSVSAVCTHLGGVLRWNDEDCSWDCPLHASRFAPDGTRIEGPATSDLPSRDADEA
ncbi:FAD-dependent oxidoreductase [Pseudoclavibacter terrae]|uniref:FAD-dependent oxidoreductase n=1 Tax=Pseudoclavibacter terrae TaxID=1530195 RepID=A0A7J5B616_9MICO|nr:FAD-dependent oxidoreductase [Pseudoclavibacter terrae]KAB1639151.1 FAD-dependent oxidoreductase [Pseudoclavibacter terrae]